MKTTMMKMMPTFSDRIRIDFRRNRGLKFLEIPIVCEGSCSSDKILFLFDTGAYITVINRRLYKWFNLEKLPRTRVKISGYSGEADGYAFQIPGLIVAHKLLTGVWAFTPKSWKQELNILGENVLEYFMPFIDNPNDCIYFPANPRPNPYVNAGFSLACDGIMTVREPN